jgi:hypothetical protein
MTTKWHMKPMKRLVLPGGVSSWVNLLRASSYRAWFTDALSSDENSVEGNELLCFGIRASSIVVAQQAAGSTQTLLRLLSSSRVAG